MILPARCHVAQSVAPHETRAHRRSAQVYPVYPSTKSLASTPISRNDTQGTDLSLVEVAEPRK